MSKPLHKNKLFTHHKILHPRNPPLSNKYSHWNKTFKIAKHVCIYQFNFS